MLTKLKKAIQMLNGVSSISILRPKKTDLELAEKDKAKGRVTQWNSVDEMFDTILGEWCISLVLQISGKNVLLITYYLLLNT